MSQECVLEFARVWLSRARVVHGCRTDRRCDGKVIDHGAARTSSAVDAVSMPRAVCTSLCHCRYAVVVDAVRGRVAVVGRVASSRPLCGRARRSVDVHRGTAERTSTRTQRDSIRFAHSTRHGTNHRWEQRTVQRTYGIVPMMQRMCECAGDHAAILLCGREFDVIALNCIRKSIHFELHSLICMTIRLNSRSDLSPDSKAAIQFDIEMTGVHADDAGRRAKGTT
jgi:hypothetical protein